MTVRIWGRGLVDLASFMTLNLVPLGVQYLLQRLIVPLVVEAAALHGARALLDREPSADDVNAKRKHVN